jgi:glycerol-3-phosphate O-acyltransferase
MMGAMPQSWPGLIAVIVGSILAYELVRRVVLRQFHGRMQAGAMRFIRRHGVRLESARFMHRVWLREALLQDPEVDAKVIEVAAAEGAPLQEVRDRVEAYVNEIAPRFSVTSYYRLGVLIAKGYVGFCYEMVFDRPRAAQMMAQVPEGAVSVFVMNHRSNADSILLSYALLKDVALSYAVGEWALVWPLDLLFKSFGSFFIRRGEKDAVYHTVLERYIQLLVGQGGVTGFFPEGRLSRDGRMGVPRAGLVDFIIGVRRTQPDLEIAFLPVGINTDHTPEDRHMAAESAGMKFGPTTPMQKLRSMSQLLVKLPMLIGANMVKVATKSHRKLGYASVSVGPPVLLSELQATHFGGRELATLTREERREEVAALAGHICDAIARQVPATPVPIFCEALRRACPEEGAAATEREVTVATRQVLAELRAAGAPVALGSAFGPMTQVASEIPGLDAELAQLAEAEMVVTLAGFALARRDVVRHKGGSFRRVAGLPPLIDYYANSVVHHLERD